METYSQDAIQQFKKNLKSSMEKALDDFIATAKILPDTH